MRKLYILDLLCTVGSLLFKGLSLMLLWKWFAVPALGLSAFSYIESVGIVILLNLLTDHAPPLNFFDGHVDIDGILTRRFMEVWGTAHALAFGWIIKSLI